MFVCFLNCVCLLLWLLLRGRTGYKYIINDDRTCTEDVLGIFMPVLYLAVGHRQSLPLHYLPYIYYRESRVNVGWLLVAKHLFYITQVVVPSKELLLAGKDAAAEYDELAEPQDFQDDPE